MNEFFEFVNCPIVKIDIFSLVFNGTHVIHEAFRVEPSFEDFVSEEDLFGFFVVGIVHWENIRLG